MGLAHLADAPRYLPVCYDARLVSLLLHSQARLALHSPVEDDIGEEGGNSWLKTLMRAAERLPAGGAHDPPGFFAARRAALDRRLADLLSHDFAAAAAAAGGFHGTGGVM